MRCPASVDRHPFNVEPPPDVLMARGFITPVSLHYVRNHGPVPKMSWDTHKLNIGEHGPLINSRPLHYACSHTPLAK